MTAALGGGRVLWAVPRGWGQQGVLLGGQQGLQLVWSPAEGGWLQCRVSLSSLSPAHQAGRGVGLRGGHLCPDASYPGLVQQGLLRQDEENLCVRQHEQVVAAQRCA